MYLLPLQASGVVVICLIISESGGTTLSDVVSQTDDNTCHHADGSQCIELDSHSGEIIYSKAEVTLTCLHVNVYIEAHQ